MDHVGIDYGSKLAGTTVICYTLNGELHFSQSDKKSDADLFIKSFVKEYFPKQIFLDAPLSLPAAYQGKGDDFFYRQADRESRAMSPMFLGGLTARAMKLAHELTPKGVSFLEVYPGGLANHLQLKNLQYKEGKQPSQAIIHEITAAFGIHLNQAPTNWHQFDSLLAWLIGLRFKKGIALIQGKPEEGLIYY